MPRSSRQPVRNNRHYGVSGTVNGTQIISNQDNNLAARRGVSSRLGPSSSHVQLGSQAATHDLVVSRNYQPPSHHLVPSVPTGSHPAMYGRYQTSSTMPSASMAHASNYQPGLANASSVNSTSNVYSSNNYRATTNIYQCMPVLTQKISSDTLSPDYIHPYNKKYKNIEFVKLNSFEIVKTLISPRNANGDFSAGTFSTQETASSLNKPDYRVLLRFCKYSSFVSEQQDSLPRSFNININNHVYTVKNKYTFAPYDITARLSTDLESKITMKVFLIDQAEQNEDFCYGVYLARKYDHQKELVGNFIKKTPHDLNFSINLVKRKLKTDTDVGLVDNVIRVSLMCPISLRRMQYPARSMNCEHIHCFDAESFIMLNAQNPKWRCPVCKTFIKMDDMILDGLLCRIIREAPEDSIEAKVFPDGHFDFIKTESKIMKEDKEKPTVKSLNNTQKNHSMPTKRSLIGTSKLCEEKQKKAKPLKEVECITLDSDEEDSGHTSEGPTSHNSLLNSNLSEDNSRGSDNNTVASHHSSGIASYSQHSSVSTSVSSPCTENMPTPEASNTQTNDQEDDIEIIYEKINQPIRVYITKNKNNRAKQPSSSSNYLPSTSCPPVENTSSGASLIQRHLQQYQPSKSVPHPYAAPMGPQSSSHSHQSNGFGPSQTNHWPPNPSRPINSVNHNSNYSVYNNDPNHTGTHFHGGNGYAPTSNVNYSHFNSGYNNVNSRYSNYNNPYDYSSTSGMGSSGMSNGSLPSNASNPINGSLRMDNNYNYDDYSLNNSYSQFKSDIFQFDWSTPFNNLNHWTSMRRPSDRVLSSLSPSMLMASYLDPVLYGGFNASHFHATQYNR